MNQIYTTPHHFLFPFLLYRLYRKYLPTFLIWRYFPFLTILARGEYYLFEVGVKETWE